MQFVSWNVNGLRACLTKGLRRLLPKRPGADFFCLQETKLQAGQVELDLPGYSQYWSYAEKKGYSGTAVFAREPALSVTEGLGDPALDGEGADSHPGVSGLLPGQLLYAQRPGGAQAPVATAWPGTTPYRAHLQALDAKKPVIACADYNVAHQEIDLKNPGPNRGSAGFSDEERERFSMLLAAGFTDTFRYRNPDVTGAYSWWSYRFNARKNNAGWRIDYFLVSDRLKDRIADTPIYRDVFGSDHCSPSDFPSRCEHEILQTTCGRCSWRPPCCWGPSRRVSAVEGYTGVADWFEPSLREMQELDLLPDSYYGMDVSEDITRGEMCELAVHALEKIWGYSIEPERTDYFSGHVGRLHRQGL